MNEEWLVRELSDIADFEIRNKYGTPEYQVKVYPNGKSLLVSVTDLTFTDEPPIRWYRLNLEAL